MREIDSHILIDVHFCFEWLIIRRGCFRSEGFERNKTGVRGEPFWFDCCPAAQFPIPYDSDDTSQSIYTCFPVMSLMQEAVKLISLLSSSCNYGQHRLGKRVLGLYDPT